MVVVRPEVYWDNRNTHSQGGCPWDYFVTRPFFLKCQNCQKKGTVACTGFQRPALLAHVRRKRKFDAFPASTSFPGSNVEAIFKELVILAQNLFHSSWQLYALIDFSLSLSLILLSVCVHLTGIILVGEPGRAVIRLLCLFASQAASQSNLDS